MRSTRFFKRLPTPQSIRENRFLKPFGRHLHHHFLWQFNRRSVAGGVAVGLFFGIMVPFAQVLFAAIAAILFRVNLPVAAFSTLITNPFTFPPIYYAAYKLGGLLTGRIAAVPPDVPVQVKDEAEKIVEQQAEVGGWLVNLVDWAQTVGLPLSTGLLVMAVSAAAAGYFLISALWRVHALRRWKKRRGG